MQHSVLVDFCKRNTLKETGPTNKFVGPISFSILYYPINSSNCLFTVSTIKSSHTPGFTQLNDWNTL